VSCPAVECISSLGKRLVMIVMPAIHYSRVSDLERPDHIVISPSVPVSGYHDGFGNWCSRILASAGTMRIATDTVISDSGLPDPTAPDAAQIPVHELPEETLVYLLPSRYCDSDQMLDHLDSIWSYRTRLGTCKGHL